MKAKLTQKIIWAAMVSAVSLAAAPICPTTNGQGGTDSSGTGCSVLITFDAGGTASISTTGLGPYDNSEDVTVGVLNDSSKSIGSITLSSSSGTDAFGFDGDGIQTYVSTNGVTIGSGGVTGYEGPTSTFDLTGVAGGDGTLVVSFNPLIAGSGGSAYFSLEGTPSISGGITVVGGGPGTSGAPEPASILLFGSGFAGIGLAALRKKKRS